MKYLENTAIGIMLFVAAISLTRIYGNGIAGFVALMALTLWVFLLYLLRTIVTDNFLKSTKRQSSLVCILSNETRERNVK